MIDCASKSDSEMESDTCPRMSVETTLLSSLGMDEGPLARGTEKAIYKASIGILKCSWRNARTYRKDDNV